MCSAAQDLLELWKTLKNETQAGKVCIEECSRSRNGFGSGETLETNEPGLLGNGNSTYRIMSLTSGVSLRMLRAISMQMTSDFLTEV